MKTSSLSLLIACGFLIGPVAHANPADPAADNLNAQLAAQRPQFSGAINEVVKLTQSGVDSTVVLTYIKTSSGPYQPSADEIVRLHTMGVSSQVITAVLERGGELRQQAPAAQPAATAYSGAMNSGYSEPVPAYAPPVVSAPAPAYVEPVYYAPPVSTVFYIGGSYRGYPSYYGNYGYRSYCAPRYYSGFYGGPRLSVSGRIGGVRIGASSIGFRGNFGGVHVAAGGHVGGGRRHR